jgi:hypothetical protein
MDLLLILNIKSKNKKSHIIMYNCLNNFFIFQKKTIFKKTRISKITLLKSPHIHKKAQQHFEQKLHKTTVVFILNSSTIFLLLKKLIDIVFLDNYINYKYIYKNTKTFYAFLFWFYNFRTYFYILQRLFVILKPLIYKKVDTNRLRIFTNYLKITHLLGKSVVLF